MILREQGSTMLLTLAAIASCTATPQMVAAPIEDTAKPVAQPVLEAAPELPPSDFWFSGSPAQGALVTGQAPRGTRSVLFNGAEVPLTPDGFFLMGFDRDAENSASLVAVYSDGRRTERYLAVTPGNWRVENVAANPTGGAGTSAEFQARRGPELARINAARARANNSNGWRQEFIRPVAGRISGLFGAQRIYNGIAGSYHSGMDIAARSGTVFVAPADGVVTLAATDAFTLEGHLLMIDHGMGLNSAFLHSSELLVKEGDVVRQGQPIGKVGMTGRTSGPHLHWGMKWNAARIDPRPLIAVD
jgi:murein DD-endopeptidase MepM/ murein hydrolase activator NlpD